MNCLPILISISCLLSACTKENPIPEASIPSPTSAGIELQSYYAEFEAEANARGLSFAAEIAALESHIIDLPQEGVAGQCQWSSNQPNVVTIDSPYWNSSSSLGREFVVFHELGHCVLGRGHDESQDQNGSCLSVMASGTGNCVSRYNSVNRKHYLDELLLGDGA